MKLSSGNLKCIPKGMREFLCVNSILRFGNIFHVLCATPNNHNFLCTKTKDVQQWLMSESISVTQEGVLCSRKDGEHLLYRAQKGCW